MRLPRMPMASAMPGAMWAWPRSRQTSIWSRCAIQGSSEVLRRGGITGQVFDENADAERLCESAEVLEGGGCVFEGTHGEVVEVFAEVNDELLNRNVFGGFERTFDLVHGIDATGFFGMDEVDCGCSGATHFAIGQERGVHRQWLERIGGEPGGEFGDVFAAGVVEVLPGGEDFDALCAGSEQLFRGFRGAAAVSGRDGWRERAACLDGSPRKLGLISKQLGRAGAPGR